MLEILESLTLLEQVLLAVLVGACLVQVFYFLFFFIRIPLYREKTDATAKEPVSVIICARNEEKNLRELIPQLMSQSHPQFQLVVVNDGSWDDTEEILRAFQVSYPNLHVINLDEEKQHIMGKKFALTLGIKGATQERILVTDADCRPASSNWITSMTTALDGKKMVLGYSPYAKLKGLLNALIRFDAFQVAITYLSFAKAGIPYMGVGRNLAYTKELFFSVSGFKSHYHVASGDDDLFVNQVATGKNTAIHLSKDARIVSLPKTSWKAWWRQKKRHFTTATHYRFLHKFLLGLFPLTYLLWLAAGIILLILHTPLLLVVPFMVLRPLLQIVIFRTSSNKMGENDVAWFSPVLELILMILNPLIYITSVINKPKQWT
jgi:cellulose synthase/poly-beta-1,6-N-acetylglucosamine synthase-like glycosyltransferase